MKYNKESLQKAIESTDNLIRHHEEKLLPLYKQLKRSLVRTLRALNDKFWLDEIRYKTFANIQEKRKALNQIYKDEIQLQPSFAQFNELRDRMLSKDSNIYFYLKRQWEHDREKTLKEMETVKN